VDYLVLEPEPYLVAQECTNCGARFFDHRDACARCFEADFRQVRVADTGRLVSFTIVYQTRPGVPSPFIGAIVDCDGTWVRANLRGIDPDPAAIELDMPLRLTTYALGMDAEGTEAVGFAYEPADDDEKGSR
jgi:uncharacterized OB-fold protein